MLLVGAVRRRRCRVTSPGGRRATRRRLREAKEQLEREASAAGAEEPEDAAVEVELDPERFVSRGYGRREWLREGRRALDEQREEQARPVARDRTERLFEAARRLEEQLEVEHQANAAYEAYRARGVMGDGRRFGGPPKPYQPQTVPQGGGSTSPITTRR